MKFAILLLFEELVRPSMEKWFKRKRTEKNNAGRAIEELQREKKT